MTPKQRLFTVSIFLLPAFLKAEGQEGLVFFLDAIDFIKVFTFWTITTFIFLFIVGRFRHSKFSRKQKIIIWTLVLVIASFHWTMIKSDPYPTEGPIDALFYDKKRDEDIARQETEEYLKQISAISADSVTNLVSNLKIVKDQIKLIDSLSKGQRHVSLIPTLDDRTKNIYLVKICEDNGTNKVTYFNFLVDANSMTIINADGKLDGQ